MISTQYVAGVATTILVWLAVDLWKGRRVAGKRYGSMKTDRVQLVPFELVAVREDDHGNPQPEVHEFTARPCSDAGDLAALAEAGTEGTELLRAMIRMIKKIVVDYDGVPERWTPEPVKKPANAKASYVEKFRGPDEQLYPMEEAERFTNPKVGSSRRRLMHLLLKDEARVELKDLAEVMQDMMAAAASRPTTARSPS